VGWHLRTRPPTPSSLGSGHLARPTGRPAAELAGRAALKQVHARLTGLPPLVFAGELVT